MMRGGQGKILDEALDGHRSGRWTAANGERRRGRDSKWWGWGDPAVEPELDGEALATLRERVGELGALAAGRGAGAVRAARGRAAAAGAGRGGRRGERLHRDEDRVRHATGCGYADLARLRGGRLDGGARRRRCCRPTPTPCARVLEVCAAEGIAVVPFGGGTSVVGGVEPLRGAHARLISLDLGRPARRRGRPALADRAPRRRPARARGGSGARRRGRRPRPLPAVLRVRDDRRLRGDPLGRAGLERLRPLRRPGQRGAADRARRRPAHAGDPAHRRRPGAARARRRLGGGPRRDPGGRPCGCARSPRERRYEAWIAESFEAGAEIVRALAQGPGPARRDPRLRRGGDRGLAGALRAARARRRRSSAATSACAAGAAAA